MSVLKALLLPREMLCRILNLPEGVEIASVRMTGPASQVEVTLADPSSNLPDGEFGGRVFEVDGHFGVSFRNPVPLAQKGSVRGQDE